MSTGIAAALEDLRRNAAGDRRDLRRNWGGAYEITEDDLGVWRAVRRDSQVTLIATSPGRLRDLITANYTARPVPRSPGPRSHPLMTSAEVATVFRVDLRTVRDWADGEVLECLRLPGGHRRYFRAQVEALARGEKLTPEQMRAERERPASWPVGRNDWQRTGQPLTPA